MSFEESKWSGQIKQGDIVVIAGDGGSGKSTLLKDLLDKTQLKPHWIKNDDRNIINTVNETKDNVVVVFSDVSCFHGMDELIAFNKALWQTKNAVIITCSKAFAKNWLVNIPTVYLELGQNFVANVTFKAQCSYIAMPSSKK